MRVAVVYYENGCENVKKIATHLARGAEAAGHQVAIVNMRTDSDVKLTIYEYLLIGTAPNSSFSGKISDKISEYLKNSGKVSGTKSYAFVAKKGFFSNKALQNLMKTMEKEGMFLKVSDVISNAEEAEIIGTKLHIK
jgi:menaquinone-dependent protoporphyrinogen IX oxidase